MQEDLSVMQGFNTVSSSCCDSAKPKRQRTSRSHNDITVYLMQFATNEFPVVKGWLCFPAGLLRGFEPDRAQTEAVLPNLRIMQPFVPPTYWIFEHDDPRRCTAPLVYTHARSC